jgi:hypothetical protein
MSKVHVAKGERITIRELIEEAGDGSPRNQAAARPASDSMSDNLAYLMSIWFVRRLPVIGSRTVPLTVEALVPHAGKLNTLSQRA